MSDLISLDDCLKCNGAMSIFSNCSGERKEYLELMCKSSTNPTIVWLCLIGTYNIIVSWVNCRFCQETPNLL